MKATLLSLALLILAVTVSTAKEPPKPKLKVISVASAFDDADKYSGELGIEGVVASVDAKARAFEILTPNPPDACQEECCAPKRLPVSVPAAQFRGALPKKDARVVVVGTYEPLTVGFDFKPKEVRVKDKVVISKK